jgi:protease-4
MDNNPQTTNQIVELKPKLGGFLISYIILSLPGFLSGLLWLLISVLVFISVIAGLASGNSNSKNSELPLKLTQDNKATSGVLIYDLRGQIQTGTTILPASARATGIYTELVKEDFAKIKKDTNIKNVVFRLNTPGGSVFASEILGDLIADLIKAKGQSQAVFYYDQLAASGGLLATMKNENNYIVGSTYGETGSIGVVLSVPNYKKLADNIGYSETVIKSTPNKDYGNPLRDLTPDERNFLQNQINDTYNQFVGIVQRGRKLPLEKVKEIANGFIYPNTKAKDYGLLDELGSVDLAVKKAADNAKLGNKYNVWELSLERGLLDGLVGNSVLSSVLGISEKTAKMVDRATVLQPGVVYALDLTKY